MRAAMTYLRFRISLWVWARIVPVLAWRSDLVTLLNRVSPPSRTPYSGLPAAVIAYRAKRAVRRPRVMVDRPCLRQGILADRFLRLAGYQPELRFGISRQSVAQDKLAAHCWVVLHGKIILNPPATDMIEVLVRDRDARIQRPEQVAAGS
jgi:transglutaminase superfamily protein